MLNMRSVSNGESNQVISDGGAAWYQESRRRVIRLCSLGEGLLFRFERFCEHRGIALTEVGRWSA